MSATTLRLYGVVPESIVDGPGFRYTVFVQGCPHHCPGCHNPESHDFAGGYDRTVQSLFDEISQDPLLRGVTFSGGEPFCQPAALTELARLCRKKGLTVMALFHCFYVIAFLSSRIGVIQVHHTILIPHQH